MKIETRFIHPLEGHDSPKNTQDPQGFHIVEAIDRDAPANRSLLYGPIATATQEFHQAQKLALHGVEHEGEDIFGSFVLLMHRDGVSANRRFIPVPPLKAAVEIGTHASILPNTTRFFVSLGVRVPKPGVELPSMGGQRWRQVVTNGRGLCRALLVFGYDRYEGRHMCLSRIFTDSDDKKVIGFGGFPRGLTDEVQLEWEELLDTTDWRTGPTFTGQRTINKLAGANSV